MFVIKGKGLSFIIRWIFRTRCATHEVQSTDPKEQDSGLDLNCDPVRKITELSTHLKVIVFFCVGFISYLCMFGLTCLCLRVKFIVFSWFLEHGAQIMGNNPHIHETGLRIRTHLRSSSKNHQTLHKLESIYVLLRAFHIFCKSFLVGAGCAHSACVKVQTHIDVVNNIFLHVNGSFQSFDLPTSATFIPN